MSVIHAGTGRAPSRESCRVPSRESSDQPESPDPDDRRLAKQSAPHRVVTGVDGSPNSAVALRRAVSQARQRHAELDIVQVAPADADAATLADDLAVLEQFAAREFPGGIGVPVRCRIERGDPAVVLLLVSAGAELLIIGAREHSEHGNMFGGYTVPRCLDYAQCQVDVCADHHARA